VLAVLSLAAFMASLDLFIVYAALLVPLGRLADRFGRKRGFLLGLVVFTAASAACAASSGLWMLVGFRTLQAAGPRC